MTVNNFDFSLLYRERTKKFALRTIKLYQALPKKEEARIIGKQLLRSATSVGANYRAACRARSKAEFISKLSIVLEEAEESSYWIELLIDSKLMPKEKLLNLYNESIELTKIFSRSIKTVKTRSLTNKSLTHKLI